MRNGINKLAKVLTVSIDKENGDHKLVIWSEAKKSKLVVKVDENVWKLSIIGKVYHGKI